MKPSANSLATQLLATASVVKAVLSGKSLSEALSKLPPTQKPAAQALSFYTMRHLGLAQELRDLLLTRKLTDRQLNALLLIGLCLLEAAIAKANGIKQASNTPIYQEYTLVDQLIKAAALGKHNKQQQGLLNAILRRYGRERAELLTQLKNKPQAIWNHPNWWIKKIKQAWPNNWQEILSQSNQAAGMHLRVNSRKTNAGKMREILNQNQIKADFHAPYGIVLELAQAVFDIPKYQDGFWSVQDLSAQKAAPLLPLKNDMRVLDACAAPGGKTAHLLELYDLNLTALDSDQNRLNRVYENLQRLDLLSDKVKLKCADAAALDSWWDGKQFDAILADVPCTGSGVVRRHPDIRWLRKPGDIEKTAKLQTKIINQLWQTLATQGFMLYVTCSIFPQEGEEQIKDFMQQHKNAKRLTAPGQILPHSYGDGFFYALLQKQ